MSNITSNSKIAVLITCHNRRNTTLRCLKTLYQQALIFDVYLTDDGSTDGTAETVQTHYPDVKLLQGNGSLFWGGGTRLAFTEALKAGYDYYVWLNDDTLLKPNALGTLLTSHQELILQGKSNSIIGGSMQDPVTGNVSYGGKVKNSWRPLKFKVLNPTKEIQECETINGNLVLIPHSVANLIGNLDASFPHTLGDLDYGLRARKLGCSVWIAPDYLGTCSRNPIQNTWQDTNLSLNQRLYNLFNLKGTSPLRRQAFIYARRHGGVLWLLVWLRPYLYFIRSIILKNQSIEKIKLSKFNQNNNLL